MPSSIGPVMKTILSFKRREKISKARSPRLVCSTTMGTRFMYVRTGSRIATQPFNETAIARCRKSWLFCCRLFVVLVKLLAAYRLVGDVGEFNQEVDDLFFEDRGAHARKRLRVFAIEVPDLLLLPGVLTGALDDWPRQFLVALRYIVALAYFGKDKTKPHAALRNGAIFFPRLLLGRAFIRKGPVLLFEIIL